MAGRHLVPVGAVSTTNYSRSVHMLLRPVILYVDPKILLLNIELELKSEKENAEIRLDDPAKYQSIVDAEWNIIYDKLAK